MPARPPVILSSLAATLAVASSVQAQWTVTNLSPPGSTWSQASAVSGSRQVGQARVGFEFHASLWNTTAASWIDLHPSAASESNAKATTPFSQAGYAVVGGAPHASLWSGTAASWIDLNPSVASQSGVNAVSGSQQAGYTIVGGKYGASLWSGSAASWIDLTPPRLHRIRSLCYHRLPASRLRPRRRNLPRRSMERHRHLVG